MNYTTTVPRIFELMKERRLTAREVSKATGISASSFTEWKKGRCSPGQSALASLSEFFNVPINYLVGTDNDANALELSIQAEIQQLSDAQKADALNYIKYIKQKEG